MTLKEIAQLEKDFLTPTQAAPILGTDPYWLSKMAEKEDTRRALGFPVVRMGSRTKIPRIPFLRYMGWEGKINGAE